MDDQPRKAPRSKRAIAELVESAPILSLDEVDARYPGEWVLLLVTDQNGQPGITHGRVLDHSRSRRQISRTVVRVWDLHPNAHLAPYMAGPRPTLEELRRRILEHDLPKEVWRAWW